MDEDRRDSTAALEASFAEPPAEEVAEAGGRPEESFEPSPAPAARTAQPASPARDPLPPPDVTLPPGRLTRVPVAPPAAQPVRPPAAPAVSPPPARPSFPPASVAPPAPAADRQRAVPSSPDAEARAILLVDDETEVRRVLAEHFTRSGYQVVEAQDPETAIKKAARLGKAGVRFVLITDLGMPTTAGSSFQGGFEVVKRLARLELQPPVLLMTESLSGSLRKRAKQMGITNVIFKPGLSKLDPGQFEADLRAFAGKILSDVLPRLAPPAGPGPAPPAAEQEPGESRPAGPPRSAPPPAAAPAPKEPAPAGSPTVEELSRELTLLQSRLDELRKPDTPAQVSDLVMKVAREFFERGVLFVVKNDQARGLAAFGPAPAEESLTLLVRDVVIPLDEPSVFLDVAAGGRPYAGPLPEGDRWAAHLVDRVGRFRSTGVALLPLLTQRQPIALLFGDNPQSGRPPGRIEALAVFMNQAGIALENAFLQRKILALQARGV